MIRTLNSFILALALSFVLLPLCKAKAAQEDPYRNGCLILDQHTSYIMYRGRKIAFNNSSAFSGLGYKWTNLYGADTTYIQSLGTGINSSNVHHPWGSWVLGGKTVYFVHEDGLIPITTYDIFSANGGEAKYLVPMNWYDWQLPQLSFMDYNDSRLKEMVSGEQVMQVKQGKNFIIELEANPSTGYDWVVDYDSDHTNLVGRKYKPFSDLPGAGGMEQFEFQALKAGETYIRFYDQRSWETVSIQQETYKIIIE